MALFMLIVSIVFRLSLDWIEIQDQKKEIERQKERDEKIYATRETVATRTEEFEMYMYEYGA